MHLDNFQICPILKITDQKNPQNFKNWRLAKKRAKKKSAIFPLQREDEQQLTLHHNFGCGHTRTHTHARDG